MKNNLHFRRSGARAISATHFLNHPAIKEKKYFILVEGWSDKKFWNALIDAEICEIIPMADESSGDFNRTNAKQDVIDNIKKMNIQKKKYHLGIVDADFDNVITKNKSIVDNLLYYDVHDLEMMLFSNMLDSRRLLSEYADFKKIKAKEVQWNMEFISKVFSAAYSIGIMKYVNIYHKTGKSLSGIELNDIVDEDFNVNINVICERLYKKEDRGDYKNLFDDVYGKKYNMLQICNGHDISELLRYAFIPHERDGLGYGNEKNSRLEAFHIESRLRAVYDISKIYLCEVYKSIVEWQNQRKINIFVKEINSVA
jgi:hypothetical protein